MSKPVLQGNANSEMSVYRNILKWKGLQMKTKREKKVQKLRNKMRPVHLTATIGMFCEMEFKQRAKIAWLIFHGARKPKLFSLKKLSIIFMGYVVCVTFWFLFSISYTFL